LTYWTGFEIGAEPIPKRVTEFSGFTQLCISDLEPGRRNPTGVQNRKRPRLDH
jgi:hypothetical protein